MREKTVKRFYCDYCSKGGFRRAAILSHEGVCIRNPNRGCPVCAGYQLTQTPLINLLEIFQSSDDLNALRKAANGCPACILSAIVQKRFMVTVPVGEDSDEERPEWINFDYKKELSDFRCEHSPTHEGIPF